MSLGLTVRMVAGYPVGRLKRLVWGGATPWNTVRLYFTDYYVISDSIAVFMLSLKFDIVVIFKTAFVEHIPL